MYKAAVVGERDSVYGFTAIGMDVFPVAEGAHADKLIQSLAQDGYAIIFVTEQVWAGLDARAQKGGSAVPAVIPIPGVSCGTQLGVERVKGFVRQAVGSDILFGDKY